MPLPPAAYHDHYAAHAFERSGLFRLLQRTYNPSAVLYPGCSLHVTPSFFFPNVVYVDRSEAAKRFFADPPAIQALITRHADLPIAARWRFLAHDYSSTPLPLPEASFDLLLALYAPVVVDTCLGYLRRGGFALLNYDPAAPGLANLPSAAQSAELRLHAVIAARPNDRYLLTDDPAALPDYLAPAPPRRLNAVHSPAYRKSAEYYLFQKQ